MYQNEQIYWECQLISLWNAARYYGLAVPTFKSKEYRDICRKCKCIRKGCLTIKCELKRLGIYEVEGEWNFQWIKNNLPVEIGLMCKRKSYHSVLIVDVHGYKFQLANYARKRLHWMKWSKIKELSIDPDTEYYFSNPISYKIL